MRELLENHGKSYTNSTTGGNISVTMRSTPKNKIDKKSNRIFHPSEGLTLASPNGSKLSEYNEQQLKLPVDRDRTVTE